jgi:peptidoglycan/xylan/chitin deacetylase (PgdA/CDA1 family)
MWSSSARVLRAVAVAVMGLVLAVGGTAGGQVAAASDTVPSATATPAPAYLTLLYSRTQWASSLNCSPLPNTVTAPMLAAELQRRGLRATGTVVTRRIHETSRDCMDDLDVKGAVLRPGGVLYASWADIASLRNKYGWKFVSHSRTYRSMTTLSAAEQRDEACGSLEDLRAHGHLRASGYFAYPNNHYNDTIQRDVVSSCYAFGRAYGTGLNNRSGITSHGLQRTVSVNGGNCNIESLPCYTFTAPRRYASPVELGNKIAALTSDQWFVMQHYRFVKGTVAGHWDCRGTDWRQHWTDSAEQYCWNDYLSVLDRIPQSTVVTDPKTVATAWGR